MQIVLFRHGPAEPRDSSRWPDDRLRPLTPRGDVRTRRAARGLAKLLRGEAAVLTSPLVRAVETAKRVAEVLNGAGVEVLEALAPGGSERKLGEILQRLRAMDAVILVGHEPDLGQLAGSWIAGAPVALPLKKAGACSITFAGRIQAGAGELDWFLPPRALRRIGGGKKARA